MLSYSNSQACCPLNSYWFAGVINVDWLWLSNQLLTQRLQTTCPSSLWVRIQTGTLDSFMWGSYPASLRNVSGSTQVPIRAWNNARKGTWGLPPPVRLERRDMTYTSVFFLYFGNGAGTRLIGKKMCYFD
jgi:hypothetical protein